MDDAIVTGLVWYVVFLFSTTCHEAAHALAAKLGGDPTAYAGGQVTLDPLPHIKREPVGMVIVPLVSLVSGGWVIGWASTPYDQLWAHRHPKRAALMALAGPAANLCLVLGAAVLIHAGLLLGLFQAPPRLGFDSIVISSGGTAASAAALIVSVLYALNLILFVFNLLPLPPLDGAGAIPLLLSDHAAQRYRETYRAIQGMSLIGMIVAWKLFPVIFQPIFSICLKLLYPGLTYR